MTALISQETETARDGGVTPTGPTAPAPRFRSRRFRSRHCHFRSAERS